jgi:hypothetical protein
METQVFIDNVDFCCNCGAEIKREGNSLHVWDIEYKCGSRIWGAIDTKTHGDAIMMSNKCKIDKDEK